MAVYNDDVRMLIVFMYQFVKEQIIHVMCRKMIFCTEITDVDELIKQLTEFVKDNADGASEFCMELCVKYAGLLSFGCNSICDL